RDRAGDRRAGAHFGLVVDQEDSASERSVQEGRRAGSDGARNRRRERAREPGRQAALDRPLGYGGGALPAEHANSWQGQFGGGLRRIRRDRGRNRRADPYLAAQQRARGQAVVAVQGR